MELYIANKNYSSWSLRPWVLMKELGIPFTERLVPFGSDSNWQTFRQFSPNGKVPCLVTPEGAVWESLAIVETLAEQWPRVWPADALARRFARSASAEMHAGFSVLRGQCPMNCAIRVSLPHIDASLAFDLKRVEEIWVEGLHRFGGPFLAGSSFSAVDAFFCPVAFRVQSYGLPLNEKANAYCRRLLAVPAMQQWYRDALEEPWIEPSEEAVLKNAVLLNNFRARKN